MSKTDVFVSIWSGFGRVGSELDLEFELEVIPIRGLGERSVLCYYQYTVLYYNTITILHTLKWGVSCRVRDGMVEDRVVSLHDGVGFGL